MSLQITDIFSYGIKVTLASLLSGPLSNKCGPLRWRHNDHARVSNHQPHGCLLNRLYRRTSKKTSKLRVTGLCAGNSPGTGEFPAQMASYAENVSIWWRHHGHWTELSWIENSLSLTSNLACGWEMKLFIKKKSTTVLFCFTLDIYRPGLTTDPVFIFSEKHIKKNNNRTELRKHGFNWVWEAKVISRLLFRIMR